MKLGFCRTLSLSCFVLAALCVTQGRVSAFAKEKSAPTPPHKTETLEAIEAKVEAQKEEKKKLEQQENAIKGDLGNIKGDLVGTAEKVQQLEKQLQEIETRRAKLIPEKQTIEGNLERQRNHIANLVMALERIRRLPPETLVAKPDAPLETAQAATVMSSMVPQINVQAARLRVELEELARIEATLTEDESNLKTSLASLTQEKTKMDKLLASRQKTLEETRKKMAAKSLEIETLSKQAKDFKDLIERIAKKNREIAEEKRRQDELKSSGERTASLHKPANRVYEALPSMGRERLPVSGIIKTRYGEKDNLGATSEGITLESRSGSVVVAPMGGIVRYAGDFRKYGNIVLIEHKNKYHSLVAGMGKIDTFVGQTVDAGEPIGRLPSSSGKLYYELRYQGDPINPSRKISNIN
ncbi:MAG: peptidoglycan DD-metalloendopeptidase family protein [Pseudobdellovibrionaceae bacterium]